MVLTLVSVLLFCLSCPSLTVSQTLCIPFAVAVTFLVCHGGAHHLYYLTPDNIEYVLKVDWISQPFNIMSLKTGKMSVTFLILRLLRPSSFWRKWFLFVNIVLNFLGSLTAIFTFALCNPPRALSEGTKKLPHAKCWDPKSQLDFSIFSSSRFENKGLM